MKQYKFDVRQLIDHMGGPARVHRAMTVEGLEPPGVPGIRKWARTQNVGCQRLAQLVALSEKQGARIDLNDYLKVDLCP